MKLVGAHVPTTGGVQTAPVNASAIGARAFALFTKNQRQWYAKPYDTATVDAFNKNMELYKYKPEQVLPHDSYLINLGNPDKTSRKKSIDSFIDELNRCHDLGLLFLNTHPGNALDSSLDECIETIAQSINFCLDKTSGVTVVLENTAGQGSAVGYTFEHLAAIIDKTEDTSRIGICFDTCHAFAAGYDLRTADSLNTVFKQLDAVVGLTYLKGMHLNDCKSAYQSNVDRHQNLGKGTLGTVVFSYIMNDKRFEEIPLILETIDDTLWPEEIEYLYSLVK